MLMSVNGAVAPVVYGGKIRAVMAYIDRQKLEARRLSPLDVMNAMDNYNVFLPTGDAKIGDLDYALDSNSMFDYPSDMGDIPLHSTIGNVSYLRDVATPKDAAYIQTNVVRIDGKKEVYIPVFRQLEEIEHSGSRQQRPVPARRFYSSFDPRRDPAQAGDGPVRLRASGDLQPGSGRGARGHSLLADNLALSGTVAHDDDRRHDAADFASCIGVHFSSLIGVGQTINVMTLAGLTLAIGPMIDSAIICLENTHRHLGLGANSHDAAFLGASEVAMPELVSTLCTFLVLAPLALMPGMGEFLFMPLTLAVAFAMCSAYILSRTLVPTCSAAWLSGHGHGHDSEHGHGNHDKADNGFNGNGNGRRPGLVARAFARWERMVDGMFAAYARGLAVLLGHRLLVVCIGFGALAVTLAVFWPIMRRDFYPEVDGGAFEMYARAPSGTRIERTEEKVALLEEFIKKTIPEHDLELIVSEIGVNADWSAAYTPNAGPMDAVIKVQLKEHRSKSAQEYVHLVRTGVAKDPRFQDMDFGFDAGGLVRGAMNEGKSTPINIRVTGKDQRTARAIAEQIRAECVRIDLNSGRSDLSS